MKRILFILLLSSCVPACKKCADCETITTTDVVPATQGYPQVVKSNFELCGDDLKNVNEKPIVTTTTNMGITVTVTSVTTCK